MPYVPVPDSVGEVLYGPFGHFTVGNDKFYSNFDAMKASKASNQPVKWNYYDQVWKDAHDLGLWRNLTLPQLYVQRARQLRQHYDHVAVLFSGGWDSRNILDTFEKENLHVDAIVVYVIPELENSTLANDTSANNWYGEIKYHALPYAREFCKRNPRTKLIEVEWVAETAKAFADPDTLLKESRPKPGFYFGRSIAISRNAELIKSLGNKKGCLIAGMDKPCIIHKDLTNAQGFFPEGILRFLSYPTKSVGFQDNQIWEAFYWTPDLPELAIRGWYELLRLCRRDPIVAAAHNTANDVAERFKLKMSNYVQDTMRGMLYKQFDIRAWQAAKQNEWGFFMSIELPVINILNERGLKWADILGEVLIDMTKQVGESNLVIGDRTQYNTAPWVNKFMSERNTVLDYKTFFGEFIKLDMDFV